VYQPTYNSYANAACEVIVNATGAAGVWLGPSFSCFPDNPNPWYISGVVEYRSKAYYAFGVRRYIGVASNSGSFTDGDVDVQYSAVEGSPASSASATPAAGSASPTGTPSKSGTISRTGSPTPTNPYPITYAVTSGTLYGGSLIHGQYVVYSYTTGLSGNFIVTTTDVVEVMLFPELPTTQAGGYSAYSALACAQNSGHPGTYFFGPLSTDANDAYKTCASDSVPHTYYILIMNQFGGGSFDSFTFNLTELAGTPASPSISRTPSTTPTPSSTGSGTPTSSQSGTKTATMTITPTHASQTMSPTQTPGPSSTPRVLGDDFVAVQLQPQVLGCCL
jgi:hypothetical protein